VTTYPHDVDARRPHVNVWLVAVIGLTAALVGLAAWVLVDRYAGTDPTAEATALIDDFNTAVSTSDWDTLATLVTSDFEMRSLGDTFVGADELVAAGSVGGKITVERIAPVTVEGDFATTYNTVSGLLGPMVSVFQLKDGKIFRIWSFELGSTPPFDNAVVR